jgi:acetoacetyl-CoA synthetase
MRQRRRSVTTTAALRLLLQVILSSIRSSSAFVIRHHQRQHAARGVSGDRHHSSFSIGGIFRHATTTAADPTEESTPIPAAASGVGTIIENKILWQPSKQQETAMYRFKEQVLGPNNNLGYEELWRWSVSHSDEFWTKLISFLNITTTGSIEPVRRGDTMPDVTYFPNLRLNFAQNLLQHADDPVMLNAEAIVSISEARPDRRWTFQQARDDAARIANALRKLHNVGPSSACGAYMPNVGETIVTMLGVTMTGSMWTSCSPDFGAQAVADRFVQVAPTVLFVTNGYVSKGVSVSMVDKVQELIERLPSVQQVVVLNLLPKDQAVTWTNERVKSMMISYEDFLQTGSQDDGTAPTAVYEQVNFAHPQFVLYSSGTTGLPKSIAHGAGNVLLQHGKELILHSDVRKNDRLIFYTTCGWMMWNWMASTLLAGATVVTYDGFAAHPKLASPWELLQRENITHFGTTPRYLQSCRRRVRPAETYDLSNLRVILSTGSPLLPEDFDYVYEKVKSDVLLASISGGTDICSCFALGNPLLPVRQSELQSIGLGLDVAVLDRETGQEVPLGEKGELACRSPFVAAPVCFWGDDEKQTKYREAYFNGGNDDDSAEKKANNAGIWYHGDLVQLTGSAGQAGGLVIHGRSDTTLKPGGVRIGTAEVYRFAESVPEVEDSLVIGEQIKTGQRSDVRIVLFVKLRDDIVLTDELERRIKSAIRLGASDAHVPAVIRQVQKIPYTRSGKKVEVAIRDLLATGVEPRNVGALQDPSALDEYRAMAVTGI